MCLRRGRDYLDHGAISISREPSRAPGKFPKTHRRRCEEILSAYGIVWSKWRMATLAKVVEIPIWCTCIQLRRTRRHSFLPSWLASFCNTLAHKILIVPKNILFVMRKAVALSLVSFLVLESIVPSSAIIGGSALTAGTVPYFVSLVDDSDVHQCGGTLIAPDIVMTAAGCTASLL